MNKQVTKLGIRKINMEYSIKLRPLKYKIKITINWLIEDNETKIQVKGWYLIWYQLKNNIFLKFSR